MEDELRSGSNIRNYGLAAGQLGLVVRSMSGKDVDRTGPNIPAELKVVGMVTDDEGSREVDAMILCRLVEKVRFRLDAVTSIGTVVRTDVGFNNPYPRFRQYRFNVTVDTCHIVHCDLAFGDSRLVRHDEEVERLLQLQQGRHATGVKNDLILAGQEAAIINDRAVPVEEYRRSSV